MVRYDVDVTVAPPMELPDEAREALNLEVDMPDQRLGLSVTDAVDLLMAVNYEQFPERRGATMQPPQRRCRGSPRRTP